MAETGPGSGQRGSVLMLMPAAVLVLVVLGAIAVDSAVVYLAEREVGSAAAAAANDAAGAAMSDGDFYRSGGEVTLDPGRAAAVAQASAAARLPRELELLGPPRVEVAGRQVCVRVAARVRRIFAPAIPGGVADATVEAQAGATAVGARSAPNLTLC